jgi:hypothetical protein
MRINLHVAGASTVGSRMEEYKIIRLRTSVHTMQISLSPSLDDDDKDDCVC